MSLKRVALAYEVAARAHAGQTRKGHAGIPYVNHVIEVARLVAGTGAEEDVVVAAVLHDVVEDSGLDLADVEREFGPRVAALVDALTDEPDWADRPSPERKRRQAERMPGTPAEARLVKVADQTSNLHDIAREPDAWDAEGARAYVEASCAVVDACRGVSPELDARYDEALEGVRAALGAAREGAA